MNTLLESKQWLKNLLNFNFLIKWRYLLALFHGNENWEYKMTGYKIPKRICPHCVKTSGFFMCVKRGEEWTSSSGRVFCLATREIEHLLRALCCTSITAVRIVAIAYVDASSGGLCARPFTASYSMQWAGFFFRVVFSRVTFQKSDTWKTLHYIDKFWWHERLAVH